MVDRDNIKQVFLKGLSYSKDLADIASPLKAIGVSDFSYFQIKNKRRTIRVGTNVNYSHYYLARLTDYSEKSFYEKNTRTHNKMIITSDDCRKHYETNEVLQDMRAHGMGEWIYFKQESPDETIDVFGFYTNEDNGAKKLAAHLDSLALFILHLKDKGSKLLSKAAVLEQKVTIKKLKTPGSNIQNYHLGYPFKTHLTTYEFLSLQLFYQGWSWKEISNELCLNHGVIDKIRQSIYKKIASKDSRSLQGKVLNCSALLTIMNSHL